MFGGVVIKPTPFTAQILVICQVTNDLIKKKSGHSTSRHFNIGNECKTDVHSSRTSVAFPSISKMDKERDDSCRQKTRLF